MSKNKAAVALGKKSWKKRNSAKERARLKEIAKLGAAKTNAIKAAKRKALTNGKSGVETELGITSLDA